MANIIRIIEKIIVRNTDISLFYNLLSRPFKFPASCKASKESFLKTLFFYSRILDNKQIIPLYLLGSK